MTELIVLGIFSFVLIVLLSYFLKIKNKNNREYYNKFDSATDYVTEPSDYESCCVNVDLDQPLYISKTIKGGDMTFYQWIKSTFGETSSKFALRVAKHEGKKKQVSIAQIKEVLKVINDLSKDA